MNIKLNEHDAYAVINALRVARDRYREDADNAIKANIPRLADQFERQAKDAERIANEIEEQS